MSVITYDRVSILATLLHERATLAKRMRATAEGLLDSELDSDGVPPSGYGSDALLSGMLGSQLVEVDEALERLASGTYGICADCGQGIPEARLQAKPCANLCVGCQANKERRVHRSLDRRSLSHRPHL